MSEYKFNRKYIKKIAKDKISVTNFFLVTLLVFFLPTIADQLPILQHQYVINLFGTNISVVGMYPITYLVVTIIPIFLGYWSASYTLYVAKSEGEAMDSLAYLKTLKLNNFFNYFVKQVVATIICCVGLIIFVVPGLFFQTSFALVPYIVVENPELGIFETLALSNRLMSSYRLELFIMYLSFLGWIFLGIFTMQLTSFYVWPYIDLSIANLYINLKNAKADTLV